ncbi:MerR family transcriptional regulator [Methylobacterium sp. Leaf118]|uniref:MerR family transcriptional regulator n=1 Tax=Methylobacterium sp. Leaf118 TaxID=2876562 RepID=UPI001E3F9DDD|nr:MerR family transcriptional regulator [Methylobacterium sp. Leaf118]
MKAPSAFSTIGEVAAALDVPQHVLRFWEARIGEVRPLRSKTGRRRYRPEDVELLLGIRVLLHVEGYSIRGVQRLLRDRGISHVRAAAAGCEPPGAAPAPAGPQPAINFEHLPTAARAALERALTDPAACQRLAALAIEITADKRSRAA